MVDQKLMFCNPPTLKRIRAYRAPLATGFSSISKERLAAMDNIASTRKSTLVALGTWAVTTGRGRLVRAVERAIWVEGLADG